MYATGWALSCLPAGLCRPFPPRWMKQKANKKQRTWVSVCPPPKCPALFANPPFFLRLNETFRMAPVHIAIKLSPHQQSEDTLTWNPCIPRIFTFFKQAPQRQNRQALCGAHHPSQPPGKKSSRGKKGARHLGACFRPLGLNRK